MRNLIDILWLGLHGLPARTRGDTNGGRRKKFHPHTRCDGRNTFLFRRHRACYQVPRTPNARQKKLSGHQDTGKHRYSYTEQGGNLSMKTQNLEVIMDKNSGKNHI